MLEKKRDKYDKDLLYKENYKKKNEYPFLISVLSSVKEDIIKRIKGVITNMVNRISIKFAKT